MRRRSAGRSAQRLPRGGGAQILAEDPARRGLGDGADELDQPDLLVRGDPARDELDDLVRGEIGAGPADDEGLGDLLAFVVGDPDDRAIGDGRVGQQQGFEFGGRDLVALVLDQLLERSTMNTRPTWST
jgi:hypothetical protein